MNNRTYVRYGSAQLPDALGKASVSWQDTSITSYVLDYSVQGVSFVIPPLAGGLHLPVCQSALKIDPPSASKIDPPQAVVFTSLPSF